MCKESIWWYKDKLVQCCEKQMLKEREPMLVHCCVCGQSLQMTEAQCGYDAAYLIRKDFHATDLIKSKTVKWMF